MLALVVNDLDLAQWPDEPFPVLDNRNPGIRQGGAPVCSVANFTRQVGSDFLELGAHTSERTS